MKTALTFQLSEIETYKRDALPEIRKRLHQACRRRPCYPLPELSSDVIGIIAEIKKKSPTGLSVQGINVADQARKYRMGGAAAISVLVDTPWFGGCWEDLQRVSSAMDCPILAKEFIFFPEQIELAHASGADLVLLIAQILTPERLAMLYHVALQLRMTPLIEIHHPAEIAMVMTLDPAFILVNARNLKTLEIQRATACETIRALPQSVTSIWGSSITSPQDLEQCHRQNSIHWFLVGTALMQHASPDRFIAASRRGQV